MDPADLAALTATLREAFLAAGDDIRERRTVTGGAYLMEGHALGQIDVRSGTVRVRLWLPEEDRRMLEARPTFDSESGWLHVVSEEDIAFTRELVPVAYHAARNGVDAGPSAPAASERPTRPPQQRRQNGEGGEVGQTRTDVRKRPAKRASRARVTDRTIEL